MNFIERHIYLPFLVTGVGCFVMAAALTLITRTEQSTTPRVEPHPASWGSAEGFAVAGGLCYLAAGLVVRGREPAPRWPEPGEDRAEADSFRDSGSPRRARRAEPGAGPDRLGG
jgi:hypothetical protein